MWFHAGCSKWMLIVALASSTLAGSVLASQAASAAEIAASAQPVQVAVGGSAEIAIDLVLAPGEDASVFEGFFDLIGDGTVIVAVDDADLIPGGPTWDSSFGSAGNQLSIVSLTSNGNEGGTRLVGRLTVVGQQPGTFELRLGAGTLISRDVPFPELFEDVPLTTPVGTVLATVQVRVPSVPGLGPVGWVVLSVTLGMMGIAPRRRVAVGASTP